jgi:hypothetical protein
MMRFRLLRCRLLAVAAAGVSMVGCAAQTAPVSESQPAMLVGGQSSGTRVLIKSVDDGPTLWTSPGALGTRVTVKPGHHKVAVICEVGAHFIDAVVTLEVQPGKTYDLSGSRVEGASGCNVAASSRG